MILHNCDLEIQKYRVTKINIFNKRDPITIKSQSLCSIYPGKDTRETHILLRFGTPYTKFIFFKITVHPVAKTRTRVVYRGEVVLLPPPVKYKIKGDYV